MELDGSEDFGHRGTCHVLEPKWYLAIFGTVLAIPETRYRYLTQHRVVVLGASELVGLAGLYDLQGTWSLRSQVLGRSPRLSVSSSKQGLGEKKPKALLVRLIGEKQRQQ